MAQLSKGEVAQYRELGYLIPAFRLPESRVAPLRQSLDRLIRDNPDVRPEKLVSAHVVIVERASAPIALTTPAVSHQPCGLAWQRPVPRRNRRRETPPGCPPP